jgi:hypothetical protein
LPNYTNVFRGKLTVLLVKANPTTAENIIKILNTFLEKIVRTEIQKKLVILTRKRIRIIS